MNFFKCMFIVLLLHLLIPMEAEANIAFNEEWQGIVVTGTVTDQNGETLPGVSIMARGTTIGTVSGADGNYRITVPDSEAVLVFSFLGFATQEFLVGDRRAINVTLSEDNQMLEEVVVVGYGVQRRLSVTNAISTVGARDLTVRNSTNVNQALQGKLPGLTVIDRGGPPGTEDLTLRIRGITSLNNNAPLVLIDGVPGHLPNINPADIESVSVLKDAASSAIYGSRAAAGVILVTTRAPKEGKATVTYDGFVGWARTNMKVEHMDAITYMRHQNVASRNTYGPDRELPYPEDYIQGWAKNHAENPERYPEPNTWYDAIYRVAPQHSHTLSIAGGNQVVRNRISLRYLDQEGVIPLYKLGISELRARNEVNLNKFTFSSNVNLRFFDQKAPVEQSNIMNRMAQGSQWGVPYYSDGSYGLSVDNDSPIVRLYEGGNQSIRNLFIGGIFRGEYELIDGLKIAAQYSTQHNFRNSLYFRNSYTIIDKEYPTRRRTYSPNNFTSNKNWEKEDQIDLQLLYNKSFEKHSFSGILAYSQIGFNYDWLEGYRRDFFNNEMQVISQGAADGTQSPTGGNSQWGLRSYFGRVNYEYDHKYMLEASARYDGSSRFAKGYQYGFFPSASAGWRVSREDFWEPLNDVVNEFKLRGSWGQVGAQQVNPYQFMRVFVLSNYLFSDQLATGYRYTTLANEELSWETTTQWNFGIDTYILNRINITFDWYKKTTTDILLNVPIPQIMGLNVVSSNAGIVENKGIEIMVGLRESFGDFSAGLDFSANYNQNKVIDLAGTGPHISSLGQNVDLRTIHAEGYPMSTYYGFKVDGMFTQQDLDSGYARWDGSVGPGDLKYVDLNNDKELTAEDWTYLGQEFPVWTFSSNMHVAWKGLRLDLFWQGISGSRKPMTGAILEHGIWGGFAHKRWADYWTPENPNSPNPRPTKLTMKNAQMSEWSVLNGNYLRLKNVRLSYDLPNKFSDFLKIGSINVYVSATNLLTFSYLNSYNIDPEMTTRDQDNAFPQTSVTTVGLSINF